MTQKIPRYHITWVGSYTERVLKGIKELNPDKVIFLIESKTEDWVKFQQESLDVLEDYLGKSFKDGNKIEIIRLPFQESEEEILKILFSRLYGVIDDIKMKNATPSITIDVTAAPKLITYLITFIAMVLSNLNAHIRIVYTPKGIESDPKYYADRKSRYCKDKDLKLCDYRQMEKEDFGGELTYLELPIIDFELFNVSNPRTPFLLTLFRNIPSKNSPEKHNGIIYDEIIKSERDIVEKFANIKINKKSQDIKEAKENKIKKSIKTKIKFGFEDFQRWGIIEVEKRGAKYYAKKTWAGELIAPVIEDLYTKVKYHT